MRHRAQGFTARLNRRITWAVTRKPTRAYQLFADERGPSMAILMTYHTLFALLAAVVLGASVANLWFHDRPEAIANIMLAVDAAVPGLAEIVDLSHVTAPAIWSIAGALSAFALVQTAVGAIRSTEYGIRSIAGTDPRHRFTFFVWLRDIAIAAAIAALFAGATWAGYQSDRNAEAWLDAMGFVDPTIVHTIVLAIVSSLAVFVLDAILIALLFISLSAVRATPKAIMPGVLIGALGLLVLQRFSTLFIGDLSRYPVLGSVVAFIGLLLWLNLSAQVVLYASAYIVTGVRDEAQGPDQLPQTVAQADDARAQRNLALAQAQADRARQALNAEQAATTSTPQGRQASDPS